MLMEQSDGEEWYYLYSEIKLLRRVMGVGMTFVLVGRVCCDVDGTK